MPYQTVNPFNGEVLRSFDEHSDQQMEQMLANADRTFREIWSKKPVRDRATIVGKAASLMLEQKEKFARLATLEMGKRIAESRGEVELSASILKYYADNAETFLAPRPLKSIAGEAYIEYSPLGVLVGVQPWNYPYYQLARFAAPHLASGNVMLVKHAPGVPQCALAFEQLFAEVGGSDPFIVLEDYDLEDAVKMAVVGRIGNTGQTCIGAKRFIFIGPRLNQFLTMFRTALESLKIGDPFDETTTLGPLSSEAALTLLLKQVDEAVAHGAKILTGGKRVNRKGSFIQPTILTNVTPDNPAYRQEFFGPVALILPAKDEEEAIAIANDSPFGLGGSIYTKDIEHGKRVASRIETGMVFINYPSVSTADLPFGGIKRSGYGKELSDLGIQEFVNKKLICASNGFSLVA